MAEGGEGGGIFGFYFFILLIDTQQALFYIYKQYKQFKKILHITATTFHNSFSLRNSLNFYRLPKTKNTLKAQKLKKWLTLSSFNHTKIIRKNVDCTVVDTLLFWESDAITK